MKRVKLTPSLGFGLILASLMLLLSCLPVWAFTSLCLDSAAVSAGQIWRLLTGNLVHFGWAHTTMNLAAFLLCCFGLLADYPLRQFLLLFLSCCLAVGLGIYTLNPEYATYAGLSGVIHGLILAGLLQSSAHPLWMRVGGLIVVIAKIVQEQQPDYQASDLQQLIPVPVAADAHLYGALAGLGFVLAFTIFRYYKRKNAA